MLGKSISHHLHSERDMNTKVDGFTCGESPVIDDLKQVQSVQDPSSRKFIQTMQI